MSTGTKSQDEVGKIVQSFINQGYTKITVTFNYQIKQWNILAVN